jgi:uncharacterized membrane protein (DUF485 family)
MSRHNRDQQVQYIATESMGDTHPEIGSDPRIIDTEKLARFTLVIFAVLFTVYVGFLCLALITDSPLISTGLSVSSSLSGIIFGFGMIVEIIR